MTHNPKIRISQSTFRKRLLVWFRKHARDLPWRTNRTPYRVWLSEMMLQQTQVETVIPYFNRFLDRFPTLEELAAAPLGDVLKLWEGLGYYARARNLHKAAIKVANELGGEWPRTVEGLMALPGIGRYTVGAIASMAFGLDTPTLDGNLRRVFARVFDVSQPADAPQGEELLWSLAAEHLPKGKAGDYNQALMDLGATLCLPKNPRCLLCPVMDLCKARELGIQEKRPVLKPKKESPHYTQAAAVIHTDFERGFIAAEVIAYDDYVACGGEQGAKQAGKMRLEGREYVVADGDVILFRFNV